MSDLTRFVVEQQGTYDSALAELRAGSKRTHWMWFIFPQIAGLGHSEMARYYAIRDLDEARAYLAHPLLGPRLRTCVDAVLDWAGRRSAVKILGDIDARKLCSSMTLYEAAGGGAAFGACLDAFYDGERDPATLRLIAKGAKPDSAR